MIIGVIRILDLRPVAIIHHSDEAFFLLHCYSLCLFGAHDIVRNL